MGEKKIQEPHLYRKMFITFFLISGCTFGGGMVIMSVLQKKFVEELKWIEADEMMDLIAIAQSCPGVMAVNSAMIIGYRIAGVLGAAIAMVATVMPPMIILSIISVFYLQFRQNKVIALLLRGMQAGVAAVMINMAWTLCGNVLKDKKVLALLMLLGAIVAAVWFRVDIILIILVCGCIGGLQVLFSNLKDKKGGAKEC